MSWKGSWRRLGWPSDDSISRGRSRADKMQRWFLLFSSDGLVDVLERKGKNGMGVHGTGCVEAESLEESMPSLYISAEQSTS